MISKILPPKIHEWLRRTIYNKWVEDLFYPRGFSRKINGQIIKLPFRFSKFYPSIYETEKTEFIRQHCRSGSTTIDIGAHIGVFSFFLAKQVGEKGKVISFEPSPFTYTVLTQTVRLNGLENIVDTRRQVVSGSREEVTFYINQGSDISNANSMSVKNITDAEAKAVKVPSMLLDDFLQDGSIGDLSFIKIDAEGAELDILEGGKALIGRFKPFMTLEVHPKSFMDPVEVQTEIFNLLAGLGYTMYRESRRVDLEEFCSFTDCFEVFLIPS